MASGSNLAAAAGGAVESGHKTLCWFVLVGWAIYPIGYMAGTEGWYSAIFGGLPMHVVYNIGDAINKIGFGLVVYNLAVQSKYSLRRKNDMKKKSLRRAIFFYILLGT